MRPVLTCALLLWMLPSRAQMLLVEPGADEPELLHFNPAFIVRNGVTAVNAQLWTKRDGRPMQPLDRWFRYRFSTGGQLDRATHMLGNATTGLDTASVLYSYGTDGRLLQELHNDVHGYYALQMEYGPDAHLVRETHVRLGGLTAALDGPGADTPTVISDERYTYTALNDTSWRKTFLNDRGRPYQEETYAKDRLGYLRRIETLNLITQRRGLATFAYDGNGRLASQTVQTNLAVPETTTWQWTYDAAGDPLTRDLLRNGTLARHSEFLYAEGTLFLKAVITKNNETGLIEILRMEVER